VKGKGRWKEDSLRNVGRTDTQVILYSVQCYALHWTDKNNKISLILLCIIMRLFPWDVVRFINARPSVGLFRIDF